MYSFNLPGWTPFKDANELWEIESEFKEGILAKTMAPKWL